jgi:cytochrome c553
MIKQFIGLFFISGLAYASHPQKISLCAACHGQTGIATQAAWPNLNGQSKRYLIQQLQAFKNDNRISALMTPYAKMLETEDIIELSDYYAKLTTSTTHASPKQNKLGKRIYHQGLSAKRIPACSACHGPGALGNDSAAFPKLAGQKKAYLLQQLQAFKQQTRHNDINQIMQDIAKRMSNKDMLAVSRYLESMDN